MKLSCKNCKYFGICQLRGIVMEIIENSPIPGNPDWAYRIAREVLWSLCPIAQSPGSWYNKLRKVTIWLARKTSQNKRFGMLSSTKWLSRLM